jgi:hypothetical protein
MPSSLANALASLIIGSEISTVVFIWASALTVQLSIIDNAGWHRFGAAADMLGRGGRAVECTGLENRRPFTGLVSSNLTLSATLNVTA